MLRDGFAVHGKLRLLYRHCHKEVFYRLFDTYREPFHRHVVQFTLYTYIPI